MGPVVHCIVVGGDVFNFALQVVENNQAREIPYSESFSNGSEVFQAHLLNPLSRAFSL